MKGCFVCMDGGKMPAVFKDGRLEAVKKELEMPPEIITEKNIKRYRDFLRQTQVMFCSWDMIPFTAEEVAEYFPSLKVIFYAAASVRYFARPFLERGVRVLTCHRIMAIPVAEFTVSLIVFANKGALLTLDKYRKEGFDSRKFVFDTFPGSYNTRVGILGAGFIGSLVIKMLRAYRVELLVFDPFLTAERRAQLGIKKTHTLEEIFEQCQTVSNHLANNEQTRGILDYNLFSRMGNCAAFVNTARGAQVVEADLVRALSEQPLRSALLDVTDPEPPAADSPLFKLPNAFVFPHIAGSARLEVLTYPDFMLTQLARYKKGLPFEDCEVTLDMLATMA